MMGIQKSRKGLAVLLCAAALFLGGCAKGGFPRGTFPSGDVREAIDSPTVSVEEDGQITYWIVGEFDKEYYAIEELTQMAREEVRLYNEAKPKKGTDDIAGKQAVLVENVEALMDEKGTVIVTYLFDVGESFQQFTGEQLFYGTVAEASLQGLEAGASLRTVKDNSVLSGEELQQMRDQRLVVTDVKADVYCPGKVTHISEGAVLNEDGSVDTSDAEGLVYILMK